MTSVLILSAGWSNFLVSQDFRLDYVIKNPPNQTVWATYNNQPQFVFAHVIWDTQHQIYYFIKYYIICIWNNLGFHVMLGDENYNYFNTAKKIKLERSKKTNQIQIQNKIKLI